MPPSSLSKEDVDNICKEYVSGKNTSELAKEYGVNSETIRRWLKKNNIKRRPSRVSLRSPVDEFYFSKIDSPEKAYWLGFFAADGHLGKSAGTIRSVRFYLAEKDGESIENFSKDIKYGGKLRYDPVKKQKGIVFNSPQMCSDLISLGMLKWKKKDDPDLFYNIPNTYKVDFVRGFFDGDGCISCNANLSRPVKQYYLNFCADKSHIRTQGSIQQYISDKLVISNTGVKRRSNSSSIKWVGNNQVEKIASWLYGGCNRRLNRKYAKYLAVKNRGFLGFWQNFHKWEFKCDVRELKKTKTPQEIDNIIDEFTEIVRHGFEPLHFTGRDKKVLQDEVYDLEEYDVDKIILPDSIKSSRNIGKNVIFHHQPAIWGVGPSKKRTFTNLINQKSTCRRAVKAMLTSGKKIYPQRLRRELEFAGVTRASLLATPTIMAVIKKFGLTGKWFDPCAGWGTRLLAAFVLGLSYEAIDPAVQYYGLVRLKKWLKESNQFNPEQADKIVLYHSKFQNFEFPDADFLFTSPPFYNKEDYGLEEVTETFEEWYNSFIVKMINKAQSKKMRVVFHIDNKICERLEQDYSLKKISYLTGNRSKAPNEWFVEIK